MEFIDYIGIGSLLCLSLFGSGILLKIMRKNPLKSKAAKTIEDVAGESFGTLGGINEQLRKEIKSLQGQKNRLATKVNELTGLGEEEAEEQPQTTEEIKTLVKQLKPDVTDLQLNAALQIPQVKELLSDGKTAKLLLQLAPLLKGKTSDNKTGFNTGEETFA